MSKKDQDQNLNSFLETQKEHKKWYEVSGMGKQRGKPRAVPSNVKKPGGIKKHSLRKEK
ncbi:MAG: hypothetical protein M1429_04025 [Patescibacteria group bacterium]|nr:hypothetical protein [Patescibacteria group bacterium]